MIVTIQTVSQESGDYGEYVKVTGVKPDGTEATKNVSDKFRDKWSLLQEGNTIDIKMVQRNNKWQISDISLAGSQLPPPAKPAMLPKEQEIIDEALKRKPSGEEIGMWWKQLGDDLRSGHIDKSTPQGKLLRAAYFAQMFSVLNIKMGDKKED